MDINQDDKLLLEKFKMQVIETGYEREIEKERDLISQSLQMQYAFSFFAAAIYIVAQIACGYSSKVSHNTLFWIFSLISFPLIVCLVFATMAQIRMKHDESGDANVVVRYIDENGEHLKNEIEQYQYLTELHRQLQMSVSKNNNKRVLYLRISQIFLFITIGFCLIGYFVFLIIEFQ